MDEEYDRQKVHFKQYQITFIFKFSDKKTKTVQSISKLTIKTHVRHHAGISVLNFEHILLPVLIIAPCFTFDLEHVFVCCDVTTSFWYL